MQTTSVSHNSRGGVGMFSKFGKMTTYYHSCFTPRKEILRTLPIESFEQVRSTKRYKNLPKKLSLSLILEGAEVAGLEAASQNEHDEA